MEPKIEHVDAFLAVGTRYEGHNKHDEIHAMWDNEFLPRVGEIQADPSRGRVWYGLCQCTGDPERGFEYLAAMAVKSLDDAPKGMVGWEVPENDYAVFTVDGLSSIGAGIQAFYDQWLPNSSEYESADGPMFEFYPETFDSAESMLYLYFPVRKKAG